MSTKTKTDPTMKFLEKLAGGPLSFGKMIKALRECDEITQTSLAKKLKISRQNLCDIEKGRQSVSPDLAARFAKKMGYAIQQFVALAMQDQLKKAGLKLKIHLEAA